jgi:lysozyme
MLYPRMLNHLQPSAVCLALIKKFEGCSLSVYEDAASLKTVAWGHKLLPTESFPNGITQAIADGLLSSDAEIAGHDVNALVTVELNQNQFDACVSLFFNIGATELRASRLLRYINAAAPAEEISQEWALWCHAGSRVLPGLVARRAAEIALWNSGIIPPAAQPD